MTLNNNVHIMPCIRGTQYIQFTINFIITSQNNKPATDSMVEQKMAKLDEGNKIFV